jgi:cytochrome P450
MTEDRLFDRATVADPCPYFAELRSSDPVHEVGDSGMFLVTRMDLLKQVVADTRTFSNHYSGFLQRGDDGTAFVLPLVPEGTDAASQWVLATADPPDHTRHRRLLQPHFSSGAVDALVPVMRGYADELVHRGLDDGRIEWMGSCAVPLPMRVLARLLGLPESAIPKMLELGFASGEQIGGLATPARLAELEEIAIASAGAFVLDAYQGQERDVAGSLVGDVAAAVERGDLDELEALAMLAILVIAGGESTTSLVGNAAYLLARDPDVQHRLRAEPGLVPAFVEEAVRLESSFRNHPRLVTEDTELAGVRIPRGSHVALVWPAANRDPEAFADPDAIALDRANPRGHVAFGWGIHLCLGAPLARAEARVAIETLLQRTTRIGIDPDAEPPIYVPSLMARRLVSLHLRAQPA